MSGARRFRWEMCGRQMVAKIGPLSLSVVVRGSAKRGDRRWMVGEMFGRAHHGERRDFERVDDAIRVAEGLAMQLFSEATQVVGVGKKAHDDAKRKAVAEVLRARAAMLYAEANAHESKDCEHACYASGLSAAAHDLEEQADALWPRRTG